MPTTRYKNMLYRAALPLLAPSPRGQMKHEQQGRKLNDLQGYERLLCRHHVLGSSMLLSDGTEQTQVMTSVGKPAHTAKPDTVYRVASITKMATSLVTLMLVSDGAFGLDDEVRNLLPGGTVEKALDGITVRQLLSHTSSLCDTAEMDRALAKGGTWHEVLAAPGVRSGEPGRQFRYCNFGFGLLGCILEHASGKQVAELYRERLFDPLGMTASLDASQLDESRIMPISRVLRYHEGADVVITKLGRIPLTRPDPERHFGHTAGAMYTDPASLGRLMELIMSDGQGMIRPSLMCEMRKEQATYGASSPGMSYGLGLVMLENPAMSSGRILGHQGYAYGCADGAFVDEKTGRQVIFLNGGCSEAREGRLGLCNRDLLRWALRKEMPSWR